MVDCGIAPHLIGTSISFLFFTQPAVIVARHRRGRNGGCWPLWRLVLAVLLLLAPSMRMR
jgi:hypothetical protein